MTDARRIAAQINANLPQIKSGTLRFWGDWFGRPYDNIHRIVSCEADDDLLKLSFDGGEVLFVWSPRDCEASETVFRIAGAAKVRWEWFFYGRPKTENNRFFIEYKQDGDLISAESNSSLFTPKPPWDAEYRAVEIL